MNTIFSVRHSNVDHDSDGLLTITPNNINQLTKKIDELIDRVNYLSEIASQLVSIKIKNYTKEPLL